MDHNHLSATLEYLSVFFIAGWDQSHCFALHCFALHCTVVLYGSKEVELCDWPTEIQMVRGDCLRASSAVWELVLKARATCVSIHQPHHHTPVLSLTVLTSLFLSFYIVLSILQAFISLFPYFLSYSLSQYLSLSLSVSFHTLHLILHTSLFACSVSPPSLTLQQVISVHGMCQVSHFRDVNRPLTLQLHRKTSHLYIVLWCGGLTRPSPCMPGPINRWIVEGFECVSWLMSIHVIWHVSE